MIFFLSTCRNVVEVNLPAYQIAFDAISEAISEDNPIIVLERWIPFNIYEIEEVLNKEGFCKFLIYPENHKDLDSRWRIKAIGEKSQVFKNRVSLLEEWCGLRDNELQLTSGIKGAIFVHKNGFIGAARTLDDVYQMGKKSLNK